MDSHPPFCFLPSACLGRTPSAKVPPRTTSPKPSAWPRKRLSWPLTTPEVALWRFQRDTAKEKGNAAEAERTDQQWILHGSNLGYHYDGSGRFFIRLGDEFAAAMLKLRAEK